MRSVRACGHFSSSCACCPTLLVTTRASLIAYHLVLFSLLPCMHDPFFSSSSHLFERVFSKLSPFLFPPYSVPHCCCVTLLLIPLLQLIHFSPHLCWCDPSLVLQLLFLGYDSLSNKLIKLTHQQSFI